METQNAQAGPRTAPLTWACADPIVLPSPDSLCVLPGHFAPQYLGATSSSKAALAYIQWLQQVISDGNQSPDYATVRPSHARLVRATKAMPALAETVSSTELSCSQMYAPLSVLATPGCMHAFACRRLPLCPLE